MLCSWRRCVFPSSLRSGAEVLQSALGLLTVFYRIVTWKINENAHRHRFIPIVIEVIVICLLLAAFVYGAVETSRGRGACGSVGGGDGDDGDDDEDGGTANGSACRLTKAASAFGAGTWASFVASAYTVGKGMYDET